MNSIINITKYLCSPEIVALLIGGIFISVFGFLSARSKEKRTPKWIAWGTCIAGLLVICSGIYSGYGNQQTSMLLQSKTEKVATLSQEITELAKTNANLNKEIKNSILGGDSFCYLYPLPSFIETNTIVFNLMHLGKYPVHDVRIIVIDSTKTDNIDLDGIYKKHFGYISKSYTPEEWASQSKEEKLDDAKKSAAVTKEIDKLVSQAVIVEKSVGTISHIFHQHNPIFKFHIPSDRDQQKYTVDIRARNGLFFQTFIFKVEKKQWRMESKVIKKPPSGGKGTSIFEFRSTDHGLSIIQIVKGVDQ